MRFPAAVAIFFVGASATGACGARGPLDDAPTTATDGGVDAVDAFEDATETGPFADSLYWGAAAGSRLRPVWWQSDDGARAFRQWRDTQFAVDCVFLAAADDVERCLPLPEARLVESAAALNHFADASCTQPLVTSQHVSASPCPLFFPYGSLRYAIVRETRSTTAGPTCDGVFHVYPLAGPTAPAVVYTGTSKSCVATGADPAEDYYAVGTEVPASAFVAGAVAVEPRATRLSFATRTGADGSRERLHYVDTSLDVTCGPAMASDGVLRCVPDITGLAMGWLDPSCTGTTVEDCRYSSSCSHDLCGHPVPYAARLTPLTLCEWGVHVLPVLGPLAPGAPIYGTSPTSCGVIDYAQPATAILGNEIDPTQFVAMSRTLTDAPTRLRRYLADPGADGPSGLYTDTGTLAFGWMPSGWRDSERGEDCEVHAASDGQMRCLPAGVGTSTFADAACTQPVVPSTIPGTCTGLELYVWVPHADTCVSVALFPILPEYASVPPLYAQSTPANSTSPVCAPTNLPQGASYRTVAASDVALQMARVQRRVE